MAIAVAVRPVDVAVTRRLGGLPPNWFASVMGTGIVANSIPALGVHSGVLYDLAFAVWLVAAGWLTVLSVLTIRQWRADPDLGRGWFRDPVISQFYGAPPMAMLTVGAGTLLFGQGVLGPAPAFGIAVALWLLGTVAGVASAVAVPLRMISAGQVRLSDAFAGWLMPVVPPMVSAATGAALIPHLPAGHAQQTLLFACYALFGFALAASVTGIAVLWAKLLRHGTGPAKLIPTLFIVLGPLGQSITAANLLGGLAPSVLPSPYGRAFEAFGLLYGVPVWGCAMTWLVLASVLVVRTARVNLPFSLTWWSFTFPIGTCVTGTAALAHRSDLGAFWVATIALYVLLVSAWTVVGTRTVRGAIRGTLFS
jgi:C4-dicarboxylate transporter/malic acid transport protein